MTRRTQKSRKPLLLVIILIVVIFTTVSLLKKTKNSSETIEETIADETSETASMESTYELIDLQSTADNWLAGISGHASVYIYDLDNDQVVANSDETEDYNTASLYKLFVIYEGYLRLESGEWQADDIMSGSYTVSECLDLAIRESYSPCAEAMWYTIGPDELDEIIATEFGITNSDISNLTSNPADIAAMLKNYYQHEGLSDDAVAAIQDSMLNQPPTNKENTCTNLCDWRQGLPSGFSDDVNVYNKVGWAHASGDYWLYYHDAAIVEITD